MQTIILFPVNKSQKVLVYRDRLKQLMNVSLQDSFGNIFYYFGPRLPFSVMKEQNEVGAVSPRAKGEG